MNKEMMLLSVFLISGCQVEDVVDIKCVAAGCSDQICTIDENAKDLVTTCEYKEEYSCLKFSNCKFIDDKCQWEQTDEYLGCLDEVRG
jgi:eight-cysteine-cluster-containing protein